MVSYPIYATTYFSNNVMVRRQVSLSRAMTLIDHICAVIPPDAGILEIHSPTRVVLVPDRIIFNVNRAFIPRLPQPTKRGVYERDKGTCAYCGKWIQISAATLDHVIPLRQGGKSTWENLVNCCSRCNQRKGGRTPEGAHMNLLFRPEIPKVRLRPD